MFIWILIVFALVAVFIALWFFPQKNSIAEEPSAIADSSSTGQHRLSRREKRRLRRAAERAGRSAVNPLPKVAYTQPNAYFPPQPIIESLERADFAENDFDDDWDHDHYSDFVDETWRNATVEVDPVMIDLDGEQCRLVSLTPGPHGYPYVNVRMHGSARKSYAGDSRHTWSRNGVNFKPEAFLAMMHGVDPDEAMRPEPLPSSYEEALSKDRVEDADKRYVIHYISASGEEGWRVVSRVLRRKEDFTARCHLRWGNRRTFKWANLQDVINAETGEVISLDDFKRRPKVKKSGKLVTFELADE